MRRRHVLVFQLCMALIILPAVVCNSVAPACASDNSAVVPDLQTMDGAALLNERCAACHSVRKTTKERLSRAEWEKVIANMIDKGAKLSEPEKAVLIDYLAKAYAP